MKKFYIALLLLSFLFTSDLVAQPVIKYQRTVGGNKDDYFASMDITRDTGLIAVGYSYSGISAQKTEPLHNAKSATTDYWVVKMDQQGRVEWDRSIGGDSYDVPTCVHQTADGGYIICGYSRSGISGDKTEASRGQNDYWIVKLNSTGAIEWDKTLGGEADEWPQNIIQTNDGGYMISGHSYSGISGDKTEANRGIGDDFWFVKLDGSGNLVWQKTIGGDNYDETPSIQQTTDNGFIVCGSSYSGVSGEKTDTSKGFLDYWLLKLDETGNIQWQKTIGGSGYDAVNSLKQTFDGGYILCGTSDSPVSGDKTGIRRGKNDYWIVKLDNSGNIQWNRTCGGNEQESANYIIQTRDSGYVIAGTSYSGISGEKTEASRGQSDVWIIKLSKNGFVVWDKTIGGDKVEYEAYATQVNEIVANRYLLGCASSSGISGDKTQASRGGTDYWFVQFDYKKAPAVAANNTTLVDANKIMELKLYPNPVHNTLNIQPPGKTIVTISNAKGKIMLTKEIQANTSIDVSNWLPGLYFIKTAGGLTQKFMINR